jgi:hypothetical protein
MSTFFPSNVFSDHDLPGQPPPNQKNKNKERRLFKYNMTQTVNIGNAYYSD